MDRVFLDANVLFSAAIGARATHLLTGDTKDFGRYYGQTFAGVLILPPAMYRRTRRGGGARAVAQYEGLRKRMPRHRAQLPSETGSEI